MKAKTRDDFLMSPTVDYCFKELLAYPEIRKGFVAAILNQDPEKIAETTLMPTILGKDTELSLIHISRCGSTTAGSTGNASCP